MNEDYLKQLILAFYKRAKDNYQLWNISGKRDNVNLRTRDIKDILREYKGYDISVKLAGLHNVAKLPMIYFLKYNQRNSDGFYPVIHYYGDSNTLVAFIGISTKQRPSVDNGLFDEIIQKHRDPMLICNMEYDKEDNLEKLVKFLNKIIRQYEKIYKKYGYKDS